MTVEWALLGTAASQQADGTLAVLNAGAHTFGSVAREVIPPVNQHLLYKDSAGTPVHIVLVGRVTANRSELSQPHRIEINVTDADGESLVKNAQPVVLNNDPNLPPGWPIIGNLVMNLNLAFYKKFGEYSVNISIDGDLKKAVVFRIVPLQQQFQIQQPPPPMH